MSDNNNHTEATTPAGSDEAQQDVAKCQTKAMAQSKGKTTSSLAKPNALRNQAATKNPEWARQGSNLWPPPCQGDALPLSYAPGP